MAWKPRHEAHAIERVRVMFNFSEPVPSKLLRTVTSPIVDIAQKLGFTSTTPVESGIGVVAFNVSGPAGVAGPAAPPPATRNGVVLKRIQDENVLAEEVGFRDLAFGYMTKTYGRWANLVGRLEEVVYPPLKKLSDTIDLETLKLEYWDTFSFEGDPKRANATEVLAFPVPNVPENAVSGESLWHSHAGWFEGDNNNPILINRNVDLLNHTVDGGEQRVMGIYTLAEQRSKDGHIPISSIAGVLDHLHKRSAIVLGETLRPEYRTKIGLRLENYK